MPPLNLPGYYFDPVKNRYFPLSSKPKTPPPQIESSRPLRPCPSQSQRQQRTSKDLVWDTSQKLRTTGSHARREHAIHAIQSSQIASTSRCEATDVPMYGSITSFCATKTHGQTRSFIGDSRGWLYSSTLPEAGGLSPATEHWTTELNLGVSSPISSICASGSRCVASIFSPASKIFIQDLNVAGTTYILNLSQTHDVRSSHLQDRSLVLGAATKAVYLQDIETSISPQCLATQSDVFAVHQQKNLVYAGTRNGSIHRFDVRVDESHSQKLFNSQKHRSSALHLNVIHDWQLLTSHMNGDLATFDLRFLHESAPIMKFHGHVNSNTERLGIAVDPSEDFLFAAGQDCRIRAWSLRTGRALSCPSPFPSTSSSSLPSSSSSVMDVDSANTLRDQNNPLRAVFHKHVQTIQITDEKEGIVLWAASGTNLFKYHLGQRT